MAPRNGAFDCLRVKVWQMAHKWTSSVRHRALPVPLEELAKARNIKRVRFAPILSTAGLKKTDDGYVIVINPVSAGERLGRGSELTSSTDWRYLTPRVRFSIAHEIAHVLFYDSMDGDVENAVFLRHWKRLERACNQIAGALLLPTERLVAEVRRFGLDFRSVENLRCLFCVSVETLLRRLQDKEVNKQLDGMDQILTLVRHEGSNLVVRAPYIRGPRATSRFRVKEGDLLDGLGLPTEFQSTLSLRRQAEQTISVSWTADQVLQCKAAFYPIGSSNDTLLSVMVVGGPDSKCTNN